MEGYSSEQEQIEALRRWWRDNSRPLVVGVLLAAAIVIGWHQWVNYREGKARAASEQYEQVLAAVARGDSKHALIAGGRLLGQYSNSPYAVFTALTLAKLKVEQNDLEGSRYYLQWAVAHSRDAALRDVARLRLARVLLAKGDAGAALTVVDQVGAKAHPEILPELKGDILSALGRRNEARNAYREAMQAVGDSTSAARLRIKLDNAEDGGS